MNTDRILNNEQAKEFLRGLGLRVPEWKVRRVAEVL